MPNWCDNRVVITGNPESIAAFKKHITDKFFHSILPMPEELRDTTTDFTTNPEMYPKYGASNWYDWANENWGTKWDVDVSDQVDQGEDEIILSFETAWGPPEGIYKAIRNMYPDLDVSWFYNEPGMQFAGYLNTEDI